MNDLDPVWKAVLTGRLRTVKTDSDEMRQTINIQVGQI